MIVLRSLTETILLKNPNNPKINPQTWFVSKKILRNSGLFYIVEKIINCELEGDIFEYIN